MYICKSCGMTYAIQVRFCSSCGSHVIDANNPINYSANVNQTNYNVPDVSTMKSIYNPHFQGDITESMPKASIATKIFGFLGMILSILGLVLFFLIISSFPDDIMFMPPSFAVIAFAISLAGWIMSGTSRSHGFCSAVTKTGKIISIFATILNTLSLIIALVISTHI